MENNKDIEKNKEDLLKSLDKMLEITKKSEDFDCSTGVCIVKGDKSLVERIDKKIIIQDGRQLLI